MPRGGKRKGAGRKQNSVHNQSTTQSIVLYPKDLSKIQKLALEFEVSESEIVRRGIALLPDPENSPERACEYFLNLEES